MKVSFDSTFKLQFRLTLAFFLFGLLLYTVDSTKHAVSQPCKHPPEDKTAQYYRLRAEQGNADAQSWMGTMTEAGCYHGIERNLAESIRWRRAAANQGDAHSQAVLASYYWQGYGVPLDQQEAFFWISRAAAFGYEPHVKAYERMGQHLSPLDRSIVEQRVLSLAGKNSI